MVIQVENITKSFNEKIIFKNANFLLNEGDVAFIVGNNGCGKTTLLNIINNSLDADSGNVIFKKGIKLSTLNQFNNVDDKNTIYQEVLKQKNDILNLFNLLEDIEKKLSNNDIDNEKLLLKHERIHEEILNLNGYAYKSEVMGIIRGLGFDENNMNRRVSELSGGEKTRLCLAKLFSSDTDFIILDEPTNHLDVQSIEWLENYIKNSDKTFLIVSHDRYFIDRIANKIIEIKNTNVREYKGNYSDYIEKSNMIYEAMIREYENQQAYIKKQEEIIKRFKQYNTEKSVKKARSREKLLAKLDVIENPHIVENSIDRIISVRTQSGNDVLTVNSLSKSFDDKILFKDINFFIKKNEVVSIIGKNGCGKSTLLKIILRLIKEDDGDIVYGKNVEIGYLDQEQDDFDYTLNIFDEIRRLFPNLTDEQIRTTLAGFSFYGEDVFKLIKNLSGGERSRLKLCILFMKQPNFLILDEPTNHLDLSMIEVLENIIKAFDGTVLLVSHDRYFLNRVTDRILSIDDDKLINYLGNYDYYIDKRKKPEEIICLEKNKNQNRWFDLKKEKALVRKNKNRFDEITKLISKLEEELDELKVEIEQPDISNDFVKLQELYSTIEDKENDILLLIEEQEELKKKL